MVAALGQTVLNQLFPTGENPIGAVIQVKGTTMRVIGTLAPKGQTPYGTDQDDVIMIPFATAEHKVLGVAAPRSATFLAGISIAPSRSGCGLGVASRPPRFCPTSSRR
jgi:macrolide transport system ATP-binding/permease protein